MSATPGAASLLAPRILIPFLAVALIWGSTWLVIKDQVSEVPPSWTVTWRFLLASVGMVALALVRGESLRLSRRAMGFAVMIGLAQFCANFQLVYRAELSLTSGLVAVVFALLVVPNALGSWLFLGQRVSARFVAGSAVAFAGIALLMLHEYRLGLAVGEIGAYESGVGGVGAGFVFTALAILSASTANILQAAPTARAQPIVPLIAWAMIWGTLADVALALAIDGAPRFDPSPRYVGGIVYLALIGSVVTFPLYFQLIRDLGPGRAAYNGVIVPVIAMALSTLFEGYRWSLLAGAGAGLALVGLVLALSSRNAGATNAQTSARSPSTKVG